MRAAIQGAQIEGSYTGSSGVGVGSEGGCTGTMLTRLLLISQSPQ